MNHVLLGAIGMASLIAGLLFARSWKKTGDRFFLFFAASFVLEGVNRFAIAFASDLAEDRAVFYLIRVAAFSLIVAAIAYKNRD